MIRLAWLRAIRHGAHLMAYLVDVGLALAVALFARFVGFDRDRVFYPAVMIVIASYHGLFAVMDGSTGALLRESVGIAAFVGLTIVGFKVHLRWVVAALAAWWPQFCLAYDVTAAGFLGWILHRRHVQGATRAAVPLFK